MKNLPKKVTVFGQTWKVVKYKELIETPEGYAVGQADFKTRTIRICTTYKDEIMHTFIHELVHVLWRRISLIQTGINPEVEEIICDSVATLITETFRVQFKP